MDISTDTDPNVAFREIYEKAISLGLTASDLGTLKCIEELRAPRSIARAERRCAVHPWHALSVAVALVALIFGVYRFQWPISTYKLAYWWFELQDMDFERETCLVGLNEVVMDFTRPPVDCSTCHGVTRVDRVRDITPELFEQKYAYTGRPVVIEDGAANWTAPKTFSFNFFKSIYTEDSPALENMDSNCQFFPYKTDFKNLGEVFNMSKERSEMKDGAKPWYIGWYVAKFTNSILKCNLVIVEKGPIKVSIYPPASQICTKKNI